MTLQLEIKFPKAVTTEAKRGRKTKTKRSAKKEEAKGGGRVKDCGSDIIFSRYASKAEEEEEEEERKANISEDEKGH